MTDVSEPAPEVQKAHCSQCGGIRNCDVRGEHVVREYDDHYSCMIHWRILQCRGCEFVFVETSSTNSEDYEPYYEHDGSVGTRSVETKRYWPALSKRQRPDWLTAFGVSDPGDGEINALDAALLELYDALDADLRMLAGIGIRTAYDIASELLGIDTELTFAKKMDALVTTNRITSLDRSRLEAMIDAGSASAHRGWRPQPHDLETMMDVLEHFIYETFVSPARKAKMDAAAEKMKGGVPPRKPRKPKAKVPAQEKPDSLLRGTPPHV